ncbi:class A beta-lactamase [Mycobacterium sp. 1423905.2]|uniref:class A beta-lactamase n=1 Tax=Mycobacterium sp. 1423905.2 TaxID=1856859 RepID=UPI0007FF9A3C|nr:class A beta-lactamase [Mycobacterium sp. 1423905.2]OBJ48907.1 class A beta-lactamase [Mycobacterium sp. 1423905.2]
MDLSRRQLLLGTAAVLTLTGSPRAVAEPAGRIDELEDQYHAIVGVYARDLASGRAVTHRADDAFAMCSTFKVYAAARVLQKCERGELDLAQATFIDPAALQPNSPVTAPHAGDTMPLSLLCAAALQRSDNTAANLLLQAIGGPPAITDFARSIGDDRSRLDRWEIELNTAIPGDPRDTSTPRALGGGIEKLLTGAVLASSQRSQLETWMRGNVTSTMRAGLPPGWTTADKTGTGDYGSTNDIGVAYGPDGRRVLLAIMTRSQADDPNADALQTLIADVTRAVLPALAG